MNISYAGRFRCAVQDGRGRVVEETGWIKNLVLDQGLKYLGNGAGAEIGEFATLYIGVGQKAVATTDTALQTRIGADVYGAATAGNPTHTVNYDPLKPQYITRQQVVTRFGPFQSSQNLTEVGLGAGVGGDYFLLTRALIRDTTGTPTVLTVRKGGYLTLTYELVQVWATAPATYQVQAQVKGTPTAVNVTTKLCDVGTLSYQTLNTQVTRFFADAEAFAGDIGNTIADHPGGERRAITTPKGRWQFDEATLTSTETISIQGITFADGIKALRLPTTRGIWQVGFNTAAGKGVVLQAENVFEVVLSIRHARYEGAL